MYCREEPVLKKDLTVGIILLFIISAVSSMVIGNEVDVISDLEIADAVELETIMISGPIDSPWPMYCHDNNNTGRSPYNTSNNPMKVKWTYEMYGHDYHCSPVIDDEGIIYVARHELFSLYPNGTLKWTYDYPWRSEGAPAIDQNGIIYFTTRGGGTRYLYAVYSDNGTLKWKYHAGGKDITSSPAIGDDGTIYFGDWYGWIHAVYPNGTMKWKYKTGNVITGSAAIGPDGIVYIGSHDDRVYALYPNNGTVKWSFKTGSWVHGSPSIGSDGTIYIGSDDDNLYALHPDNGTEIWSCNIGGTWSSPVIDENGILYVGVFDQKFYAIYPNGTKKWMYEAPGRIWLGASAAISADGIIYFGTTWFDGGEKMFIALNPDGSEKWRYEDGGEFESSPAIGSDGTVYVVSTKFQTTKDLGTLYAFGELDPNAPEAPIISGETSGKAGKEYSYMFNSTDPNGDDVYWFHIYCPWFQFDFSPAKEPYDIEV